MTSIRHKPEPPTGPAPTTDDGYLDSARENILAVGWRRTTLTDVARRAGVSRMTIYRRWPDMSSLLGDLLVREWGDLLDDIPRAGEATGPGATAHISAAIVDAVARLRENPLLAKIVDVDPELLLPYLLRRRGRNQDHVVDLLAHAIAAGQAAGTVRHGNPRLLAETLLLSLQGFVLSTATLPAGQTDLEELDAELATLIERYLAP